MKGLVIKNTGSWYQVYADGGAIFDCKLKGNFRRQGIKSTNPVAVGDRVQFDDSGKGYGQISAIEERKNCIVRRSTNLSKQSHIIAANLDQVFLIATVNYPQTSTTFIDRFLASAEAYRVRAKLIFNKTDLYSEEENQYLDALIALYEHIGYPCLCVSAKTGEGIDEIKQALAGKITLFSGHSGVGKSTLINVICPELNTKTNQISDYHNKGMHTTTFSEMFPLEDGAYLIDSPGIKGFGSVDLRAASISHYFPDIFSLSEKCRFYNCTHVHEPDCAVLEGVEKHQIARSRYQSYLGMLSDDNNKKYR